MRMITLMTRKDFEKDLEEYDRSAKTIGYDTKKKYATYRKNRNMGS